ncbi:unnamed protein product, partial [marine sediment metagenome]
GVVPPYPAVGLPQSEEFLSQEKQFLEAELESMKGALEDINKRLSEIKKVYRSKALKNGKKNIFNSTFSL